MGRANGSCDSLHVSTMPSLIPKLGEGVGTQQERWLSRISDSYTECIVSKVSLIRHARGDRVIVSHVLATSGIQYVPVLCCAWSLRYIFSADMQRDKYPGYSPSFGF